MSRSKKELFQLAWVEMTIRLPPDNDEYFLYYSTETGIFGVATGSLICSREEQLEVHGDKMLRPGDHPIIRAAYTATHWLKIHPPK